mmetsp:Transcript_2802/g.9890  ORF Transcript_2802/g.9890 Transcript_2802/m.9890 type:complete len:238 (+) Transcript_2802:289-1002(+)
MPRMLKMNRKRNSSAMKSLRAMMPFRIIFMSLRSSLNCRRSLRLRSTRRRRKVRSALRPLFEPPAPSSTMLIMTMKPSMTSQPLVQYTANPSATCLRNISTAKVMVRIRLIVSSAVLKSGFMLWCSMAIAMVLMRMQPVMKLPNLSPFTTGATFFCHSGGSALRSWATFLLNWPMQDMSGGTYTIVARLTLSASSFASFSSLSSIFVCAWTCANLADMTAVSRFRAKNAPNITTSMK